ncbi:hypothetical protein [Stackebrandtia soli]|uniref:hypothetical protein n=1 Tax=Stackebrandtia soli TaxID=1892856 RepID=UPI0039E9A6CD
MTDTPAGPRHFNMDGRGGDGADAPTWNHGMNASSGERTGWGPTVWPAIGVIAFVGLVVLCCSGVG